MSYVTKINIEVTFPFGGHFYTNPQIIIYKQLLQFIHRLTCLAPNQKCKDCPLKDNCRYFYCTGENFNNYPGILIHVDQFYKSIYRKEENEKFVIYLIGSIEQFKSYVQIFFESYLNQKIAGTPFYLKSIYVEKNIDEKININSIRMETLIENYSFIRTYNNTVNYYNDVYNASFITIPSNIGEKLLFDRNVNLEPISLMTRKIKRSGVIIKSNLASTIYVSKNILEIGIGKYNFIGGGYIAN